jgi:preprotein translocase, YajC subunit
MDEGIGQFILLILIFVIFYFFLIRRQKKKVKEHKGMVEALKRGDKVNYFGGIVGNVERVIDNEKVEVMIADNVKVEIVGVLE